MLSDKNAKPDVVGEQMVTILTDDTTRKDIGKSAQVVNPILLSTRASENDRRVSTRRGESSTPYTSSSFFRQRRKRSAPASPSIRGQV